MPSPIGHMLGGAIAGQVVAGRRMPRWVPLAFGVAGAAPDLDLLFGIHSGPTHGVGFALLAGALAAAAWRGPGRWRVAAAFAAAYGSHTLLDWLSTDTSPPLGIMALWPFSTEYYLSPYRVFLPVSRKYWLVEAWLGNLRAVIRELLILGPLVWVVWWIRSGVRMRSPS
jgi:inner membrane protein